MAAETSTEPSSRLASFIDLDLSVRTKYDEFVTAHFEPKFVDASLAYDWHFNELKRNGDGPEITE